MIEVLPWGMLPEGRQAHLYRIQRGGVTLTVSDLGCTITSLIVPDRNGEMADVVLGYDTLEAYLHDDAFFGAVVGRYANRIAGASFALNGQTYQGTPNEGRNLLHGGQGVHHKLWTAEPAGNGVTFSLLSPDGEDGFPGALTMRVAITVENDDTVCLRYSARSDKDTVLNLTNHSYFNLNGQGAIDGHQLFIAASAYTPVNDENIPTGEIVPVQDTPFDFTALRPIGGSAYDHNFVLQPGGGVKACLYAPQSGRRMQLFTDQPGVQLYTSGALKPRRGRGGAAYGPGSALCLETQHFPNSPNEPSFPSTVLKAGEAFTSTTALCFDAVTIEDK